MFTDLLLTIQESVEPPYVIKLTRKEGIIYIGHDSNLSAKLGKEFREGKFTEWAADKRISDISKKLDSLKVHHSIRRT